MLQAQMDTDRKIYEAAATENQRLVGCVDELNTKLKNLQGEVKAATLLLYCGFCNELGITYSCIYYYYLF